MLAAVSTMRMWTIALALLSIGAAAQADSSEPFGLATIAAPEGPLWATWRKLQSEMQSEKHIVAQCRTAPRTCTSPAALRFIAIVNEGNHHAGLARIGRINRAVNLAIGAASAAAVQTTWNSPLQALAAGTGDCKLYAVLKYAVLEDAGFAASDLRLVIAGNRRQQVPAAMQTTHAFVAVHSGAEWIVLDNRSLAMIESKQLLDRYMPLFALDQRGVRQFVQPPIADGPAAPCSESGK